MAEDRGFHVLRARGAELEREFAFGVVRQLVEPALARASIEELSFLLQGRPGLAARLLRLPGLRDGPGEAPPVTPDPSFAVLHGLYWLCANLAAQRPVALVVDDAQWADGASLRFLAFLLPRVEELRIALLVGARPGEGGENEELVVGLTMDPASEEVLLAPLMVHGVTLLVAEGLGAQPEPGFAAVCRQTTGGIPLLVGLLIEALREERVSPVSASSARVRNVATATLGRWAMLRVGRLGSDAASLAQAVAVLERADLATAARLAGLGLPEAVRAAELLVRAAVLNDQPLSFAHPLLRSGVYREISAAKRDEAHGHAARLLAYAHARPARVAEHLLFTVPSGDGWTVDQLRAAAREAASSGGPDSTAAYLRRALVEPPSPQTEAGLLLELGLTEFNAGQPGWQRHLEGAVEQTGEDTSRVAAALALASALGFHQRLGEAVQVCERVGADLDGRAPESQLMLEALAVACGLMDATIAPALADRADALLVRAWEPSVPRYPLALASYLSALANQPSAEAAELARRAIAAGLRPLPEAGEPPWLPSVAVALFYSERYGEAQALLDTAVAEAQTTADGLVLPAALSQRAWLASRRSDLSAAEADVRALLDAAGLLPPPLYRLLATGVLVDVLVERGDLDGAECALDPLAVEARGTTQMVAILRHARARLRLAQHRFAEALDDLEAVGEIATRTRAISPAYLPWRSDTALVMLSLGETDAARRLSEEELRLARIFGAPRALGGALRVAGLAAGGDRAEALLREAVTVLDGPDTRLEQARAQADLGALLGRSNRRRESRPLLRQAVDVAHRVGAEPLARRAETDLRATGAKPRRVRLSGLEALTGSERRIAELAASGLTNREIAQTLFVTARTVEGHLTHVFQKLDLNARTELPKALAAPSKPV
jgi:DNA-binding CsgD family transcriptional regulator